jgi:hypothetical protein
MSERWLTTISTEAIACVVASPVLASPVTCADIP